MLKAPFIIGLFLCNISDGNFLCMWYGLPFNMHKECRQHCYAPYYIKHRPQDNIENFFEKTDWYYSFSFYKKYIYAKAHSAKPAKGKRNKKRLENYKNSVKLSAGKKYTDYICYQTQQEAWNWNEIVWKGYDEHIIWHKPLL